MQILVKTEVFEEGEWLTWYHPDTGDDIDEVYSE